LLGLGNDEQRLAALATLVGTIADEPNAVSAGAAIRTFETPEGRVEAVRTLAAPLRALDERARRSLLGNLPEARRDEANGWIDEAG